MRVQRVQDGRKRTTERIYEMIAVLVAWIEVPSKPNQPGRWNGETWTEFTRTRTHDGYAFYVVEHLQVFFLQAFIRISDAVRRQSINKCS